MSWWLLLLVLPRTKATYKARDASEIGQSHPILDCGVRSLASWATWHAWSL
jgi:hypothetical protein